MPHFSAVHRAGPFTGRVSKWLTLAVWLLLAATLGSLASKLSDATNNDFSSWLPHSAESTRALHRAEQAFPHSDDTLAVVVYARDDPGTITAADRSKAVADRTALAPLAVNGRIDPPIESDDHRALLISFPLAGEGKMLDAAIDTVKSTIKADRPDGLHSALTGPAGQASDIGHAYSGLDSTLLLVTAAVVALLLIVTYRSPTLWLIPLISVGIASQLASGVTYLLAKHAGLTVTGQSQGILTVLVFGAGTDYALLLIARYREELRHHANRHVAIAVAVRRSLPAVLASAATVTLGLLCLTAAEMNNIRSLGPVAALGVVAAFAAMTTLLPALLVICGRWLFWPFIPRHEPGAAAQPTTQRGLWQRVGGLVTRRSGLVWVAGAIALIALAFGNLGVRTGVTNAQQYTKAVDSVTGQQIVERHYPSGATAPADIIATESTTSQVSAAAKVAGVTDVRPGAVSADGRWQRIEAVLSDPPDSAAARATVARLRASVHAVPGSSALVGGQTATTVDSNAGNAHDARIVIPLILTVVFLVLMLLLRALVAPVVLIASVVLSFAAAFGAATMIFRAIGHPHIDPSLPIMAFLFLVALGVDYTIFLMTRAREEVPVLGHTRGVTRALAVTGGVITSAGVVLAATFGVLTVLPLTAMLQLGIVVALGILLDTLLVRTLLVPALSIHLGRAFWWPARPRQASPSDDDAPPSLAVGPPVPDPILR
jgi:RND superfamily putative drug exporter